MSARLRLLAALVGALLGALLGACGSGLYDAEGVPRLDGGDGLVCDVTQVPCGGVCTAEDRQHCGAACVDCTSVPDLFVPPGAAVACLEFPDGARDCGYRCGDGLLRCASGCCPATALAAGQRFTCAAASDGQLWCWGANEAGQLGDGTTADRAFPAPAGVEGVVAIGAGAAHACAVVAGGAVRCWGSNAAGQVSGTPSAEPRLAPAATPVAAGAVEVVAGARHTCARLEAGAVRCWGQGFPATPVAAGATALAAGGEHACAVVGGAVRCWGANASGQLGDGSRTASAAPVTAIPGGVQLVGASADQSCAATGGSTGERVDDALRCWGDSLGAPFGLASPQLAPAIPMKDADQSTVRDAVGLLAVGRKHVCVRNRTEAVECLGANERGQLGGTPVGPAEAVTVPLPGAPPAPIATALAAGADHACAIVSGGRLRCWGANDRGQLGNGAAPDRSTGVVPDPGVGVIVTPEGR